MARRAGVVPFSLAAVNAEANAARRNSPSRGNHGHSQSSMNMKHSIAGSSTRSPQILYGRPQQSMAGRAREPPAVSRRDSFSSQPHLTPEQRAPVYTPIPMLAPIQTQLHSTGERTLPSIAELTTGLASYSPRLGPESHPGLSSATTPHHGTPFTPDMSGYAVPDTSRTKRRASTPDAHRHSVNRRRLG